MSEPIQFYFDFSSPYGYLGSHLIEAVAARHGRPLAWKPFMLGAVFQRTGGQPLVSLPLKGDYAKRDMVRGAAFHGVPFSFPPKFPAKSVTACRGFYWLEAHDPDKAVPFAKAVYRAFFFEKRDIDQAAVLAEIAASLAIDAEAMGAGLRDETVKAKLFAVNAEALEAGVFGSPFFIVEGEPFWGVDRLDQLDRWLATGGW